MTGLLDVRRLTVDFGHRAVGDSASPVLDGVSLRIGPGEVLALVGESGCGKTMTALSLMRLLPRGARMSAEAMTLDGVDLLEASERELNSVRGGRVAMLFQQPKQMLDPTSTVGTQIAEPLRRHLGMNRSAARRRVIDLLRDVGIAEPERRARAYAHQLSGGIAQRVMIAAALAGQPRLLIADEPTTALDVTVEAQILRLLAAKKAEFGMSVLFISHDLGVVSSIADRIAVMYAGRIVEEGPAEAVLAAPRHPYTQALVRSSLLIPDESGQLYEIPGNTSSARRTSVGCRYHPRCHVAQTATDHLCDSREPELDATDADARHAVRCWAVPR
jgi:peptide/nickel transport system ATP-binding protein